MIKIYVKIKGIHCQNCETSIQKALLNLSHVKKVTTKNFIAHIIYEESLLTMKLLMFTPSWLYSQGFVY